MKRMYSRKTQEISVVEPFDKLVSGTFSIVARSPESGLFGVAVASGSLSVGDRVPHAKPGVGVVATQAYTNVAYGTKGLELMERGMLPREVLDRILKEDLGRESRQVAMVDVKGNKAVFTGRRVPEWYGESTGKNYIVIGNMLAGREVVDKMAKEFERSAGDLAWRMVRALKAASESGGDRRGERSAALLVVGARNVEVEVIVNEHSAPIKELNRRLGIHFRARYST
jgi:uncharacterized Ntn-hydrolase superfamily protein